MEENKKKKIKKSFEKFGIGNFKSFQDIQEIEIAPITLVFGQNSGGKTSLLQSILSLSQSFEEISEGKFQLSGTKIDAGTFETALNNKSSNNQIILEISNKTNPLRISYGNRNAFLIETFRSISHCKIRLYVTSTKEMSNLYISKVEMVFSDYLDNLKLSFHRDNTNYLLALFNSSFSRKNKSNYSFQFENDINTIYKLDFDSKEAIKEINERCFKDLCDNFKRLFSQNKKGDWFNESTKEYTVNFGRNIERHFSRNINLNFLCFIKHAAIASGAYLYESSRRFLDTKIFLLKEFKDFDANSNDKKIIKIINESSNDIFKQSLDIFESERGFFPVSLETFVVKDRRGPFVRERKKTQNKFDSIASEMKFIYNYTGTRKIFESSNVFRKIELIQDLYIDKIIGIDLKNFIGKELVLEKYYSIKECLIKLNSEIIQLEDLFLKILESYKSDLRSKLTSLQNRKYLREILRKVNASDNISIELNLKNLKEDTRIFVNKLNNNSDIYREFQAFEGIDIISDLLEKIVSCQNQFLQESKKAKVLPANQYKEEEDKDINYLKVQIVNTFTLGFLFRKLVTNIQVTLKNELIKNLLKKDIFKSSNSEYNSINTLIWLLSSEYFDEINSEESESIKEELFDYVNKEFPLISISLMEEHITQEEFSNHLNHLIPSPFLNAMIIPPSLNNDVVHLGPSRPGAKRFYTNQDIERAEADDVAYFLKTQLYKDKAERLRINSLNSYLSKLDIVAAIRPVKSEDPRYDFKSIFVESNQNSKPVNLADTGYGLSQLFPIIINAITRNSNTILIQQPETHLHPRLQAEVGSILVDSINRFNLNTIYGGKQWIVETHSEIMLLRILKRIRNGDFESEKLRVYYVDQNKDKGSIIKRMHVSEEGELITQWPEGFFSNDIDEMFDL